MNPTAEDAIFTWVSQASGLAADHVFWEGRHRVPDSGAWILMRLEAGGTFGRPWLSRAASGVDEIEYTAQGVRRATLKLQVLGGGEGGEASCVALLELVQRKRILPSFAQALSVGGVGILAEGAVQWIPARQANGEIFEARAVVDVELTLASAEVSEIGPAIQHVELEGNVGFGDETNTTPDLPASET